MAEHGDSAAPGRRSATAWPAPAPSRRSSPAAAASGSGSRCSATSRTATTTGSCSATCSPARTPTEIYLNPLDWYADNDITLHAGVRVVRVDRFAKKVLRATTARSLGYDKLIIATGSRTFFPPMDGMWVDDSTLTPGVFGFRTLDDTTAMLDYARRAPRGGRDRRRAARAGGGLRAAAARARGARRAVRAGADEPAARRGGRRRSCAGCSSGWASRCTPASGPPRCAARGVGERGRVRATAPSIDCDMVVVTAGIRPNVGPRRRVRADRRAGDRHRRPDARGRRPRHLRGRRVRPAPRRGVRAGRAAVGAGRRARRPHHRRRPEGRLPRLADRDEAQGRRRRRGLDGRQAPGAGRTTSSSGSPSRSRGVYKSVVIRDGKLVGATLLGDVEKVAFLTQSFDRGLPLPEERVELLFELAGPSEEQGAAEMDDSVQVCNCNGVSKGDLVACVAGGEQQRHRGDGRDPGRQGLRVVQAAGLRDRRVGGDRGRRRGRASTRAPSWYVPAIPMDKPTLIAAIREQGLRSVSAVFAALAPERRGRGVEDAAGVAAARWSGPASTSTSATPSSSTTGCTPTSSATARSRWCRRSTGGVTTAERAAPDRRRRRQVRDPDDQDHRRAADRPARRAQGGPARRSGRTWTCPRATPTASRSAR